MPSAIRRDGEISSRLVSEGTAPELFSEGVSLLAASGLHGQLPKKGRRLREMLPGHARCDSLHAHSYRANRGMKKVLELLREDGPKVHGDLGAIRGEQ